MSSSSPALKVTAGMYCDLLSSLRKGFPLSKAVSVGDHFSDYSQYRGLQNVCNSNSEAVVREQWHIKKVGLFRFHINFCCKNIVQSSIKVVLKMKAESFIFSYNLPSLEALSSPSQSLVPTTQFTQSVVS